METPHTVRALRSLRDMSRRELARRADCSEGAIRKIEAGEVDPSIGLVRRLLDALEADDTTRCRLLGGGV